MDDRGSWFCHNNVPLISPKRLCNSLVTLPLPPPPSPPSLTINWQSIFHSIPFILCLSFQNPWLPPQEKMTGSLLQLLFKPTRFSRTKEWDRQTTPNKSLKAFCVSSWLRSLQTATTICKWRGHEKPIQPNSGREHHPCFTCNYDLREKIISPKFYNNRIASLAIVTQAMTAILISGPMPNVSRLHYSKNLNRPPGAKQACKVAPKQRPSE